MKEKQSLEDFSCLPFGIYIELDLLTPLPEELTHCFIYAPAAPNMGF